jgi:hypothetical protein
MQKIEKKEANALHHSSREEWVRQLFHNIDAFHCTISL